MSLGGSFFSDLISITAMLGFFSLDCGFGGAGRTEAITVTGCGLPIMTPADCGEMPLICV